MSPSARLLVIVLILTLVVCGPLLIIWTLNTLFRAGIPYTLGTWAAALALGGLVASVRKG